MTEQTSRYPIDAENVAEMARLTRQARVFTAASDLLPKELGLHSGMSVLDVACGPGEWALKLAKRYPGVNITGIDISHVMTRYASMLATEQELHFTQFLVMDITQPLAFPDASFDVVHARYIYAVMTPTLWPQLLRECYRILKPGGYMISVESDGWGSSTSPSLNHLCSLLTTTLRRAGHCFTEVGEHSGLVAVLPKLLREASFSNLQREAFVVDSSYGAASHEEMVLDCSIVFRLIAPVLVQATGTSEAEISVLYERAMEEMRSPSYCAAGFLHRMWGQKV